MEPSVSAEPSPAYFQLRARSLAEDIDEVHRRIEDLERSRYNPKHSRQRVKEIDREWQDCHRRLHNLQAQSRRRTPKELALIQRRLFLAGSIFLAVGILIYIYLAVAWREASNTTNACV